MAALVPVASTAVLREAGAAALRAAGAAAPAILDGLGAARAPAPIALGAAGTAGAAFNPEPASFVPSASASATAVADVTDAASPYLASRIGYSSMSSRARSSILAQMGRLQHVASGPPLGARGFQSLVQRPIPSLTAVERNAARAEEANRVVENAFNRGVFQFEVGTNQGQRFVDIVYRMHYGSTTKGITDILLQDTWRSGAIQGTQGVGKQVEHITGRIIAARIFMGCRQVNSTPDARQRFFTILARLWNTGGNLKYELESTNTILSALDKIVHKTRKSFRDAFVQYTKPKRNGTQINVEGFNVEVYIQRNREAINRIIEGLRTTAIEEPADKALIDYAIWYLERYRDVAYPLLAGGGIVDFSKYPEEIEQLITDACFDALVYSDKVSVESNSFNKKILTADEANVIVMKLINNIDKIWEIFDTEVLDKITYKEINDMMTKAKLTPPVNNTGNKVGGSRKKSFKRKLAKRTRKSHTLYGGTHKKNHKKHTHKRKKRRN
jgi:hypothetical protein